MQWWVMLSISPGFHELSALFLLLHQWHQSNFPCHHVTIAPCRIGQQRAEAHYCGINSVPWPKRCEALWGDVRCKIQRRFPNGFLSFLRQGIFAEDLWGSSLPLGFSGNCHHDDGFLMAFSEACRVLREQLAARGWGRTQRQHATALTGVCSRCCESSTTEA